jgi:hypothetical protein
MADIYANNSLNVVDKSASYTITAEDIGKVFVATGAITLTLPAIANVWNGWNVTCTVGANSSVTIAAPTGKLIHFNDVAANSVAFSTTNEKVGGAVRIVYDLALTKYLCMVLAQEAQTITVAT